MFAGIFKSSSTKLSASVKKFLYGVAKTSMNLFSYPHDKILPMPRVNVTGRSSSILQ
jgi:hypothetical protein